MAFQQSFRQNALFNGNGFGSGNGNGFGPGSASGSSHSYGSGFGPSGAGSGNHGSGYERRYNPYPSRQSAGNWSGRGRNSYGPAARAWGPAAARPVWQAASNRRGAADAAASDEQWWRAFGIGLEQPEEGKPLPVFELGGIGELILIQIRNYAFMGEGQQKLKFTKEGVAMTTTQFRDLIQSTENFRQSGEVADSRSLIQCEKGVDGSVILRKKKKSGVTNEIRLSAEAVKKLPDDSVAILFCDWKSIFMNARQFWSAAWFYAYEKSREESAVGLADKDTATHNAAFVLQAFKISAPTAESGVVEADQAVAEQADAHGDPFIAWPDQIPALFKLFQSQPPAAGAENGKALMFAKMDVGLMVPCP